MVNHRLNNERPILSSLCRHSTERRSGNCYLRVRVVLCVICPFGRNNTRFFRLINDKHELMIVVAVEHFNVDPGIGHSAGQLV